MKQKLFEALKTKFLGVDAQVLDRIATKKGRRHNGRKPNNINH